MRAGAFRVAITSSFVAAFLAACGSDSAESRICEAANGCGALASADVSACVSTLEGIDADRAKAECADCLEANTCAQIGAGVCTAACGPFAGAFSGPGVDANKRPSELTADERETLCAYMLDQAGGAGAQEQCSSDLTVTNGNLTECVNGLGDITCAITVGGIVDCYDAVNSPCDILTAAECSSFRTCSGL
ncbi:MAG TPA: hypothetical protein VM261_29710 [Kofleriaceae bacterium]|nr:hypothetical protein [Kofleriaceae bacterium]